MDLGKKNPEAGIVVGVIIFVAAALIRWFLPQPYRVVGEVGSLIVALFALATLVASLSGFVVRGARARRLGSQNSLESIRSLTWKQFEELVADAYRRQGFKVDEVGGSCDGGIDLILRDSRGYVIPVQCKQWRTWRVGAPKVREFVGAMAAMPNAVSGIYVTVGRFTKDAENLARNHRIELLDGPKLLMLVQSVNGSHPAGEQSLSRSERTSRQGVAEAASDKQLTSESCPLCGAPMVLRTARRGPDAGSEFWGCSMYPKCRGKRAATQ